MEISCLIQELCVCLSFMQDAAWMMPRHSSLQTLFFLFLLLLKKWKCAEKRAFVVTEIRSRWRYSFREPWTKTFKIADSLLVWVIFFFLSVTEKISACYTHHSCRGLLLLVPNPSASLAWSFFFFHSRSLNLRFKRFSKRDNKLKRRCCWKGVTRAWSLAFMLCQRIFWVLRKQTER